MCLFATLGNNLTTKKQTTTTLKTMTLHPSMNKNVQIKRDFNMSDSKYIKVSSSTTEKKIFINSILQTGHLLLYKRLFLPKASHMTYCE